MSTPLSGFIFAALTDTFNRNLAWKLQDSDLTWLRPPSTPPKCRKLHFRKQLFILTGFKMSESYLHSHNEWRYDCCCFTSKGRWQELDAKQCVSSWKGVWKFTFGCFQNAFCWLVTRWVGKINPNDLENVLFCLPRVSQKSDWANWNEGSFFRQGFWKLNERPRIRSCAKMSNLHFKRSRSGWHQQSC